MNDNKKLNPTTLSGKFSEYRIQLQDDFLYIADTADNRDGTKKLSDGEFLSFNDIKDLEIKLTKGSDGTFNFEFYGKGVLVYSGDDNDAIIGYYSQNNIIFSGNGNDTIKDGSGDDTINGGNGNDTIEVSLGNNTIHGGSGNDIIKGGWGNDSIDGGDGDDTIEINGGNNTIKGGSGNDTIASGWGNDSIDGGNGDDTIEVSAGNNTIHGGSGNDIIKGGWGNDSIDGGDGDDTIEVSSGNNTIQGGSGNDTIKGGWDNDSIDGGDGDDFIEVNGGNNIIQGGNNIIQGGNGNDTIKAGGGNNTIDGGSGDDTIEVIGGNNTIKGEIGSDTIKGGWGNDSIDGGDGDDFIEVNGGNNTIHGGNGNDTIKSGWGNDSIYGGDGDDFIEVNGGNNTIQGGSGNDTIKGGWGNDSIDGGDGDDFIEVNGGNNIIQGGNGNDAIKGGTGDETIDGGDGDDTIEAAGGNNTIHGGNGNDIIKSDWGNDSIDGGDGDDTIEAAGGNNTIHGGNGNDTIKSGWGNDSIYGGDDDDFIEVNGGNNTIHGGNGNDTIKGGTGDDTIDGGNGDDTIEAAGGNDIIDGGEGTDTLKLDIDSRYISRYIQAGYIKLKDSDWESGKRSVTTFINNIERIQFRDKIFELAHSNQDNTPVAGSTSDDILLGDDRSNTLNGAHGNDKIHSGAGNDILNGDQGNDELYGGEGNDTLNGGADNDILTGGQGDDIIDGGEGDDTIQLSGSYSDYHFIRKENGNIIIIDKIKDRDGQDTTNSVERVSFSDLKNVDLVKLSKLVTGDQTGFKVPLPVKDILDKDYQGQALSRNQSAFIISKDQLLKNDVKKETNSQGYQLKIDPSSVTGGTAKINANGDIEFTPEQHSTALMGFNYSIQDQNGNSIVIKEIKGEGYEIVDNPDSGEQTAVISSRVILATPELPKDPLLSEQWYLAEANVLPVWQHYTGKGVRIALFEPGGSALYRKHIDLTNQLEQTPQINAQQDEGDQKPSEFSDHATRVGGIMIAEKNDQGVIGVAYGATLSGFSNVDTELNKMQHYDVVNHSWGPAVNLHFSPPDSVDFNYMKLSYQQAVNYGRNGLGTIIVQAAGNERTSGDNTNYYFDGNTRSTITVGAINQQSNLSTLQRGNKAFSTPGANILVSAPGTDILSPDFQKADKTDDYSREGIGTSFSAPIVAGIAALLLEANPRLGYRDVQAILALTARRDIVEDETINLKAIWQTNGSKTWNGGGMHVSHDYGYGKIDALAAVRLAENWMVAAQTEANVKRLAAPVISLPLNRAIPNGQADGITESLSVEANNIQIEYVEVRIRLKHAHHGDLIIKLISPSGTESILMERPGKTEANSTGVVKIHNNNEINYVFSTVHLRGESGSGNWTLKVIDAHDANNQDTGTLVDWGINIHGASYNNDDQYIYTDEYVQLAVQSGRNVVEDSNGGIDTINAAAINRASKINIATGEATLAGQSLTIRQAEAIENLVGGASDDHLTGNAQCNILVGGRGNDHLAGGAGNDCLFGNQGQNTLTGGDDGDFFIIDNHVDNLDTIEDFALGQDRLILSGFADNITNALSATQEGCHTRVKLGNQSVLLKNIQANQFGKRYTLTISKGLHPNAISNAAKLCFGHDDGVTEDFSAQTAGKLVWLGSGNDTFTGTQGADMINSGGGNDIINGGDGDDILSGGEGNDTLTGGKGNDTYRFNRFDGSDTIYDEDTTPNNQDQVLLGQGITSDQLWFSKQGDDLYMQVIGTTDSITINKHYADEAHRIERFQLADGKALSLAKIDALVHAMSAFAPPAVGQTTLPDDYQKTLNATIVASWQ